jgi:carbonic anhydrase/acetyltransferase-like protein (isoleucine patch superfamily)
VIERLGRVRHYGARLRSVGHLRLLGWLGYAGSRDVQLDADVRITHPAAVSLGARVHLCRGVKLEPSQLSADAGFGRIELGDHVFVGERTTIVSHARIAVGARTMIAHNCSLMDANHAVEAGISASASPGRAAEVVIGEDCWLGTGVIVLAGVHIGARTIVGAGSVVTKSLPPDVVAAGVPARVLRPR